MTRSVRVCMLLHKTVLHDSRVRREASDQSQEGFADIIGMHRTYYSSIERGERNITVAILARVARGLEVSMSTLLREAGY